jgi:hypothetical protein
MKLWVDDLREPPGWNDGQWVWAKTSLEAIACIKWGSPITEMSLDHDLGGDDTTRPLILFLCEYGGWPDKVVVHTANPVGREWLEGMIARYQPVPS